MFGRAREVPSLAWAVDCLAKVAPRLRIEGMNDLVDCGNTVIANIQLCLPEYLSMGRMRQNPSRPNELSVATLGTL